MFKNLISYLLFGVLIFISADIVGQETETDAEKNIPVYLRRQAITGSRGYTGAFNKTEDIQAEGNSKYLRFTVHDGNLITGGVLNNGALSYGRVSGSPRLSWPKGPKSVEMIYEALFFVAAEVVDETGDTIHIVSDNYRRSGLEQSLDQTHWWGTMPLGKYFNNDQPGALDPDMGGLSEDVGLDGVPNTGDFGEGDGILQDEEDFNLNGVLDLQLQNGVGWFAISHRKETWPMYWPVGTYPGDDRAPGEERQGVRAGRWNGEFGAYVRSDQESYYVMDDRENDEFEYYPFTDEESRLPWPDGRRGLGISVSVRNYQWSARLAEDIMISIYDITNNGKELNKAVVGMYVDPDMGGSLEGDDASFDERDDITYAFNKKGISGQGLPIGYFGFAFLESPGLIDGIDNDEDGMVDESQNNGIDDDGDWLPWDDVNGNGKWDWEDVGIDRKHATRDFGEYDGILQPEEDVNGNGILDNEPLLSDVGSDGLSPDDEGYLGPDADGTEANSVPDQGEPNFDFTDNDESDQVGLTSFYLRDVDNTMADDETYWDVEIKPGVFNVRPGYQRDIAFSYGSGYVKFSGEERKHRYAIALLFGNNADDILRNKRTMQVIYDADYNFSKPPRKPIASAVPADGKIILHWNTAAEFSKDPIYGLDFECYYIYKSTDPTFDNIKTITDAFNNPILMAPIAIYDKKDGLKGVHPINIGAELGPESNLGVAYNMGTDSGLLHYYEDKEVTNGRTYYYAVVSVDQGYHDSFYPDISPREGLVNTSPTECTAIIQTDLLGRAVKTDQNTLIAIPYEYPAGWVDPVLGENGFERVSGFGTGDIKLEIISPREIRPNTTYSVNFFDDGVYKEYDSAFGGNTNRALIYNETDGEVVKSIIDPDSSDEIEEFMGDGFRIALENEPADFDTAVWSTGNSMLQIKNSTWLFGGVPVPRDYEIRIMAPIDSITGEGADTSVYSSPTVTDFQVWDVTDPDSTFKVKFRYRNGYMYPNKKGSLSHGDKIQLVSKYDYSVRTWFFDVFLPGRDTIPDEDIVYPVEGDVIKITSTKPFDRRDKFTFTVDGNYIDTNKIKNDLSNVYVVPDPYVAVSSLERKVINPDEGRGDRRVDFVNLPNECTVKIFTTSGRFVRELHHSSENSDSRMPWDLRTKDGLEIAPGIYFFVVDAPGVGQSIGRFAIIK